MLSYGAVVHVVQFVAGGLAPYPWAPPWLAVYFTSLTVLDPLAAALLWARRRTGLYVACAVLVTDSAANGYAVSVLGGAGFPNRLGQAVVTLLALTILLTVRRVSPWLLPGRRRPAPVQAVRSRTSA